MRFSDCRFVGSTVAQDAHAWLTEEEHVVLTYAPQRANRTGGPPSDTEVCDLAMRALIAAGRLFNVEGRFHLKNAAGYWQPLEHQAPTRHATSGVLHYLRVNSPALLMPDAWDEGARNPGDDDSVRAALFRVQETTLAHDPPRALIELLAAPVTDPSAPTAQGVLEHPIVGKPKVTTWLFNRADVLPHDPEYPHLRSLFAAFDLPPQDHVAVYSFLLGFFHADSLCEDRPILFVDSWQQGRGKSQLCSAIGTILDSDPVLIQFTPRDDMLQEEIAAASFRRRAVTVDNAQDVNGWASATLSGLTGIDIAKRRKYGRESSKMPGKCVMVNSVFGAASFSRDLCVRFRRCELGGAPCDLGDHNPRTLARLYLNEIRSECYHAVRCSTPNPNASSRFRTFDSRGLGAYCEVFATDPEEAARHLHSAYQAVHGLRPEAMASLHAHRPGEFHVKSKNAFATDSTATLTDRHLTNEFNGARGLGFTLLYGKDSSEWTSVRP